MGGVLPVIPQRVLGIGGTAGMVHPSTGTHSGRSSFQLFQVFPFAKKHKQFLM